MRASASSSRSQAEPRPELRLGPGQLAQDVDPELGGGRFGEGAPEQLGRFPRSAGLDGRTGGGPETLGHPRIADRRTPDQMGRHPSRRCAFVGQDARRESVRGGPLVAPHDPSMASRMIGWRNRGGSAPASTSRRTRSSATASARADVQPGDAGAAPEGPVLTEDGERPRQRLGVGVEPAQPGQDVALDRLGPLGLRSHGHEPRRPIGRAPRSSSAT